MLYRERESQQNKQIQAENHVRKVVERFYQRKKGAASGGAARAPVAVPNAPRKGG